MEGGGGFGAGVGWGRLGVRVDVNEEVFVNVKGGAVGSEGGQGRCERRSEVFVKK